MIPAFIVGVEEDFPNAQITFDKFHVLKVLNEFVDKVRREEQGLIPELKRHYFYMSLCLNRSQILYYS